MMAFFDMSGCPTTTVSHARHVEADSLISEVQDNVFDSTVSGDSQLGMPSQSDQGLQVPKKVARPVRKTGSLSVFIIHRVIIHLH
jgi:hypothetical protein